MKTKKKYNILIVILAAVAIACGIMAAGTFCGWFDGDDSKDYITSTGQTTDSVGQEETVAEDEDSTKQAQETAEDDEIGTCTICIKCSNILKHMDKLEAAKEKYVPANGVILSTSTIEFRNGETVYDILKRSSSAAGISVSARKSSYGIYVEGINGLFEFDCGGASGWKYSVNGNTPGHSCSAHKVKNGDCIVWYYTCGN